MFVVCPSRSLANFSTVIYLKLGPVGDRLIMSTDPKIVVKLPIPPENGDDAKTPKTKASKQAASRKSIPSNGGWLSAKSSNGKATTTTKKKAKTTAKKKVVKKKKAANSKTPKTSKKAATTKKNTARAAKTSEAANQMVIELLSDDDDASYESENEFDE